MKLLEGDARLHALFLQRVNAPDLGNWRWRNDDYFAGSKQDAVRILSDMAKALHDLRSKSIIHNDIKPANILYSRETGGVLIDFGLASYDGDPISVAGTPWYVAPEYLDRGKRGAAADTWALGVVMLYLLRLVPLPDLGRQVPTWMIRDVKASAEEQRQKAESSMLQWVRRVKNVLKDMDTTDPINEVVKQMLVPDPRDRIEIEGLRKAAEAWDSQ